MKQYAFEWFKSIFFLSELEKLSILAHMEAWQSGLMHRSWKPTRVWVLREFESHRFRQIQVSDTV